MNIADLLFVICDFLCQTVSLSPDQNVLIPSDQKV